MSRFAPVVPIGVARRLKELDLLGKYHLLLAHDVVKHPKAYHEVYGDLGEDVTIIMDNSVIELGKPVAPSIMMEACRIVPTSVVVLPDRLMDRPGTSFAIREGLNQYMEVIRTLKLAVMAVPQGHDFDSWKDSVNDVIWNLQGTNLEVWIGVAKNIKEKIDRSRGEALEVIEKKLPGVKVHMLGFSDSLQDDMFSIIKGMALNIEVLGIDSTVPVRLGMQGQHLNFIDPHPPRGDWWENPGELTNRALDLIEQNILVVRRHIND